MIKLLAMLLISLLLGTLAGLALAQTLSDPHPLAGCTLEQRAQVRLDAGDYVIEGSHPVEALQRAQAEHCK